MPTALRVSFRDNSENAIELIGNNVRVVLKAGAETLAEKYREGLQENFAPPHSKGGQIPHAYNGFIEGGFGPVNEDTRINNTSSQGFARDQQDYLSSYIIGIATAEGHRPRGLIGFTPSHVDRRELNYLLRWDQGTVPGFYRIKRPWVKRIFDRAREAIIASMKGAASR